MSDPYFIIIYNSNQSQHYTRSYPTCQKIVPGIRKRLNMPCGKSWTSGREASAWQEVTQPTSRMRDGNWGRNGNGQLDGNWQRNRDWQHVGDGCLTAMDVGWCNGNSTAMDGSMARTAMDDATVTQRQWTVDGDGRHWTVWWFNSPKKPTWSHKKIFHRSWGILKFGKVVLCLPHHFPKL
jgi:hypothetical protein